MGALYDFTCLGCAYGARISGGPDVGETWRSITVACATCERLFDVLVSHEPWREPRQAELEAVRCPKAKRHAVRRWKHPGVCPKCGSKMKRGNVRRLSD